MPSSSATIRYCAVGLVLLASVATVSTPLHLQRVSLRLPAQATLRRTVPRF